MLSPDRLSVRLPVRPPVTQVHYRKEAKLSLG